MNYAITSNNMEEYLDNNSATPEQIIDVAPILKPEQVNIILKKHRLAIFVKW